MNASKYTTTLKRNMANRLLEEAELEASSNTPEEKNTF
jgi:hypothetical protein